MQMRDVVRVMQNAKYKKAADAKAAEMKMMRDDVAAGRRRSSSHQSSLSVSQCVKREATTASGVDNAAPP